MAEPLMDQEIAEYLKDQGFGDLYSDPVPRLKKAIFVGEEPDDPENVITIREEAGGAPLLRLAETRSFTVRVRNEDYEDGKILAQQIHRALQDEEGILSGVKVARVTADTNPIYLGRNPDRQHVFTQTFTALTKRVEPS